MKALTILGKSWAVPWDPYSLKLAILFLKKLYVRKNQRDIHSNHENLQYMKFMSRTIRSKRQVRIWYNFRVGLRVPFLRLSSALKRSRLRVVRWFMNFRTLSLLRIEHKCIPLEESILRHTRGMMHSRLKWRVGLRLICDLAAALAYIHHGLQISESGSSFFIRDWQKVVHCNINPANGILSIFVHDLCTIYIHSRALWFWEVASRKILWFWLGQMCGATL